MGNTHAKRKKHRKSHESHCIKDSTSQPHLQPYTSTLTIPNSLSHPSSCHSHGSTGSIYYSRDSLASDTKRWSTLSDTTSRCGEPYVRSNSSLYTANSSISDCYTGNSRLSNMENHPDLTKLQNEHNAQVEYFELRLNKIRTNAMQAADRRKFAYLFKAKETQHDTAERLNEAKEALARHKLTQNGSQSESFDEDNGEIIPVRIVKEHTTPRPYCKDSSPPRLFDTINPFNDCRMFFLLPFLLPFFIIISVIRGMNLSLVNLPKPSSFKQKKCR